MAEINNASRQRDAEPTIDASDAAVRAEKFYDKIQGWAAKDIPSEEWAVWVREEFARQFAELEAQLAEANAKFNSEREHSEWLQGECNKAVDACEEAIAEAARLRGELGYIANAKRRNFLDAEEFWAWAQNRAYHALLSPAAPAEEIKE